MRIGVDLDEVAYDFLGQFRRYLRDRGYEVPAPTSWSLTDEWGFSRGALDELLEEAISWGLFLAGDPIDGAQSALNELKRQGHTIHFATHREQYKKRAKVAHDTLLWLDQHDIPFDTITFAKDKTLVDVDVFIDDNLDNFFALDKAGRRAILFDQPWNQHPDVRGRRAFWWGDVVQMIKEMPNV